MDKPENPPAFPPNAGWRDNDPNCRGMSTLDYFAGQALAGIAAAVEHNDGMSDKKAKYCAETAYAVAQAMIEERSRRNG